MKSTRCLTYLSAVFCMAQLLPFTTLGQVSTVTLPASLYDSAEKVQPVKVGLGFCEGPVADSLGTVYFSEMQNGKVWKVTPAGVATQLRTGINLETGNKPNGLDFNINGELLCCETGKISRMDTSGKVLGYIVSDTAVGPVNDLSIGSKGGIFFTNNRTAFFYRSPDGVITAYRNFTGLGPNGIEWVEEKNLLYLNLSTNNRVVVFDVAKDGAVNLASQRDFATTGSDGGTIDANYNVYIAAGASIKVFSPTGTLLGTITLEGSKLSNCVFGGPGNRTLYMTTASWGGYTGVHKLKLKVAGRQRPAVTGANERAVLENRKGFCPGMRIFPVVFNPGKGLLVIDFPSGNTSNVNIIYYNLQNREVFRSTYRDDAQPFITWNGRDNKGGLLPTGTYYAAMFADDKMLDAEVFRLVK